MYICKNLFQIFLISIGGIMYNSVEFAKYIAAFWNKKGADINMTKIQKLLYIAYGTWLAVMDEKLVNESPQAWPYGPVFPKTRDALLYKDLSSINFDNVADKNIERDAQVIGLIDNIFKEFGSWPANSLSNWSHQLGSPWELTVNRPTFNGWGIKINDSLIKTWFKKYVIEV